MPRREDESKKKRDDEPKKKRQRTPQFFDTEAQEDAEGDEDELEDEEGDDEFADDYGQEAEEARELEIAQRREVEQKMNGDHGRPRRGGTEHFASTIMGLEIKYKDQDYATGDLAEQERDMADGEAIEDDNYYEADVGNDVSRILPSAGGWKLWKVPLIRPGVERETCIAILRKFAETPDQAKGGFQIGAAYASDSVRGSLYVEALSPLHIIEALRDIRTLVLVRGQIKMVPVKEMADVFRVGGIEEDLPKRGEWARFSRGQYAGDLCLVSRVDEASLSVTVRVVPRIDLSWEVKALSYEAETGQKLPPPKTRPSPCVVTLADLEARGIESERVNDVAEAFRFKNYIIEEATGYLFKTTKVSQLITGETVKATSLEIEEFAGGKDLNELILDLGLTLSTKGINDEGTFPVGQRVWITKGDLSGISGVVTSSEAGRLRIQPDDTTLTSIQVDSNLCVKRFDLGESVKIIGGHNEGDIGLITKLEIGKGIAYILSTETHRQITCNLAHLASTPNDTITPVGLTKIDGYGIGDLVQLATSLEVGVITKILKTRRIEVLCKEGPVACDVSQLSGKKTMKLAHALDNQNNQFGTGASVELLEGSFVKKVGTVKYIWKDTLFVQIPSAVLSGGLVVVEANCVRLMQGDKTFNQTGAPGEQANAAAGGGFRGRRGGFQGRGQMSFRTQLAVMGTQVRIVGGPHKGMLGELRNIHGPDAVVLVSALGKEIQFPRSQIRLKNSGDHEDVQKFFRTRGGFEGGGGRGRGGGGGF